MLVLNLGCALEHRFEGWFGSAEEFESQSARSLVECPFCGSAEVRRLPNATRLNVAHPRGDKMAAPSEAHASAAPNPVMELLQQVLTRTEDVGERFAEEARRIHYGEAEERGIRGRTSADEARALAEEGIQVLALPIPGMPEGKLQ